MNDHFKLYREVRAVVEMVGSRKAKAERIAELIRSRCQYRWVGLYDVGETEISVLGWSGSTAPIYPSFPRDKGINGVAASTGSTTVVNDVSTDPRYLASFVDTKAELIVPVIHPETGEVVGTIDVESVEKDVFTDSDRKCIEECARLVAPLWAALDRADRRTTESQVRPEGL